MVEPNACSSISDPNITEILSKYDYFNQWYYSTWYSTLWQVLYLILFTVAIFGIIYSLNLLRRLAKNSDKIAENIKQITQKRNE